MTVIGGKFKGQKLCPIPNSKNFRPILARVKKSLFDILNPRIEGIKFLDLFAGSGAVGIEALSRGAKYCVFVDNDKKAVEIINKNIAKFHLESSTKIYKKDIRFGLEFLKDKFDIVFIGAPYKDFLVSTTLRYIKSAQLLKTTGIVIAQHHKKEKIQTDQFSIFRQEKYGDTQLTFFSYGEKRGTHPNDGPSKEKPQLI